MSAITAKASRKMKKYAVLTREPRCFLGSFDFSWEQRKLGEIGSVSMCRRIFKEQTSETGDIPFYKIGTFGAEPDAFISRELFEEYKSKYPYPKKGDILISASGSIGRTVEFAGNNEYFQDSNIVWLSHDERLSNSFLKCFYSVVKWAGIEGSTIKRLYNDNILNTVICMPSVPEQEHIGLFFENLDNLITLHQRKCALLFSPFQALISMMFTTSTFSWEQRKLGELALFNPKDELPRTFEYVDLESVVGTEMLSHRTEVKSSAPSRAQRLAHTGDLFYQTVRPYQKNNYLFEKPDNNYVFSTGYAQMRPYVDGYFLLSLVQSERFVKVVLDNCTGTSYPAINANDLAEIEVAAPSDESEAQKIGTIFRCIDNLITLHQRKFEKLTNVKKSMLEKMFPQNGSSYPEIRFKGFTDPWEQRKFEEIAVRSSVICSDDTLPRVEYEDIVSGAGRLNKDIYAKQSSKSGIAFHQGDVLYGKLRPYLQNWLLPTFDGLAVGDFWVLQPQNADSSFLYRLIQSRQFDEVANQSTGTKMPRADWKLVSKTVFSIPSNISEQAAIGTYFTALDSLITLHQRELEKLQNIKKSMLEKMFV